jgi:hypothetical protein
MLAAKARFAPFGDHEPAEVTVPTLVTCCFPVDVSFTKPVPLTLIV